MTRFGGGVKAEAECKLEGTSLLQEKGDDYCCMHIWNGGITGGGGGGFLSGAAWAVGKRHCYEVLDSQRGKWDIIARALIKLIQLRTHDRQHSPCLLDLT